MKKVPIALSIKAVSDDARQIEGWATRPDEDRVGDIVMPKGAIFALPLPFLLDHDHKLAVGEVDRVEVTDKGIKFWAHIKNIAEPGEVKDLCDKAWSLVKNGLRKAVSIGFSVKEYDLLPTGGYKFTAWEWLELSAVSVPAQAGAVITGIKSLSTGDTLATVSAEEPKFDTNAPAATGQGERSAKPTPAPRGTPTKPVNLRPKEATTMKTIQEQITALEAKRAAHQARMEEIQTKAVDENRTKDDAEKEEFRTLRDELGQIDEELKDLRDLEKSKIGAAKPVAAKTVEEGTGLRDVRSAVKVKAPKPEGGIEFARLAKAKAIAYLETAKGNNISASAVAKQFWGEQSDVFAILSKATVVAGSSLSGNWAEDLVGDETAVYADFIEYLRPMTIVGKFGAGNVPGLRNVPFRTPLIGQTGGGQAYWVGEGKPKPLTAFDFERRTLDELKVATITVVTEELIRKASPSADAILRDALAAAVAERIDVDFINPAKSASAGVSPASITNGVSAIASTGNDADAIREDIRALWGTFIAANNTPTTAVYVMSSMTALALSLLRNPLGQREFDGITMNGGMLDGVPVITSEYFAPVSAGGFVALVNASDIYFADEGGVMVDVSREASLQMLDNPTNASSDGTATSMVSMWQTNSVAFRAERILNWAKRRTSAVAVLDEVNWGLPAGS